MFTVNTTRFNSWSVSWCCDHCGHSNWPLLRIAGYPGPDAWALIDAGRAVIKGCLITVGEDHEDYECPQCETGVNIPVEYRDDDLA